jgi:hypothetical protein
VHIPPPRLKPKPPVRQAKSDFQSPKSAKCARYNALGRIAGVVLIGQRKALRIAVSNNKTQRRYSGLLEALTSAGSFEVPVGVS